jgi:Ca2+-binding RTX toxin-like protein
MPSKARSALAVSGAGLAAALTFGATPALAAYTAQVSNGTLQVTGNGENDALALRLAPGDPQTLQLDVGDDGTADFAFDRSAFTAVDVQAGGGDDSIRIDQLNGRFTEDAVTLDGGSGNDTLTGGDGDDVLIGGTGNDTADGNRGNDTALLGSGTDRFSWDPGDGSDVIEGGDGADTLAFNGSNAAERIDVTANGARGHLHRDVAAIDMDFAGVETVAVRALGSPDTITAGDLAGTGVKTVDVDPGNDTAADTVVAQGTAGADNVAIASVAGELATSGLAAQVRMAAGDPLDTLDVAGLGGDDTLTSGTTVAGTSAAAFDGGDANDIAIYRGSANDDEIGIANNGTAERVFATNGAAPLDVRSAEGLSVQALGGNDSVTGQNGISLFAPLTIDGGSGNDTLRGGDGADVLLGNSGNDVIDGNRGTDDEHGGTGNDTFLWDPGDGSDALAGDGGADALQFNGSNIGELIDVTAQATGALLTRNVAAVSQSLAGIETVGVNALGAADTITVGDLSGTGVGTVDVDPGTADAAADTVIGQGTAGADKVSLNSGGGDLVTSGLGSQVRMAAGDALDTLLVAGMAGDDTLISSPAVAGTAAAAFDGGEGIDTAIYRGTANDDEIGIVNNAGAAERVFTLGGSAPLDVRSAESLDIQSQDGNDTVTAQNGLSAFAPLTIEGGTGEDVLRGGDGADTIVGGSGDDVIDGNRGDDSERGGSGNDTFLWDPGDGSDVLDGDGDNNTLQFNGSNIGEQIDVSAVPGGAQLTRNVAAVTQTMNDVDDVEIAAQAGADQLTVNDLTGSGVGFVGMTFAPDASPPDTVVENGTPRRDNVTVTREGDDVFTVGFPAETRITGAVPADTLAINTLDGRDSAFVAPEASQLITSVVDLGAGQ